MKQIDFEYFWPLTQQISLDLDYANCEKPKLSIPTITGTALGIGNGGIGTWSNSLITSKLSVDIGSTVFRVLGGM
jgi:hypothetical protein